MSPDFATRMRKIHRAMRVLYAAVALLLVGLLGVIAVMVDARTQQDDRLVQEQAASADLRADVDRLDFAIKEANRRCRAAKDCTPVSVPTPGPAGAPGEPGEVGATGQTGPAGITGATGPTGPRGATGPVGPPGPVGTDGADGLDGQPGANGKDGPPGSKGEPGSKGDPGKDGANGQPGADGQPGQPGADGLDGAVGPTGPAGPQGEQGIQGLPGMPGLLQVVTSESCSDLLPITAISLDYDRDSQTLTLVCA